MATRDFDPEEEKKSYGAVFLLATSLLVFVALWAVWDDNFTRRSWKRYQAEFNRLDYAKAKAAYDAEDKKLQADPTYRELTKKLAAERARLERGDLARRLAELRKKEAEADIRFAEVDQEIKFIKSELEEAWYEHDHAVQTGANVKPHLARIRELEAEQKKLEPDLERLRQRRESIKQEIKKIESGPKAIEDEIAKVAAERDKWVRVMDNAIVRLGPVSFYKIPKIRQVVLSEFDRNHFDEPVARVDRCQTCHLAINRPGFENEPHPFKTHPRREVLLADNAHPPEKFGCTVCHDGQGTAVNTPRQAHGEVPYWERPLLRGAKVQASCTSCHLDVQRLQDAPLLAQGQRLFEQIGCTGCHPARGYEDLPKIGPSLRRISAKVDPSWAVRWIQNPQAFLPRTRMPNFSLTEDEAIAITAFLWSVSSEEGGKWLEQHPPPAALKANGKGLAERGRSLAESIGCKGCHGFADGEFATVLGKEKDVVPNLKNIAAKVDARWIYHWIKNPRGFSPETRMPSLRLSDEEAAAITAYLTTLGQKGEPIPRIEERLKDPNNIKRGESLVRKNGCFGCHDIPGMEKESRIGVELTTFGSKTIEDLFFGNRTDIRRTWDDWTYNKLKTPRIYATERVEQIMPQFNLADEDIQALRVVLAGFRESKVPAQYRADQSQRVADVVAGRRLVHQYNCIGCHEIEHRGGFIRKYYERTPELAPPPLNGEGEKVQSNWLFSFIKEPTPIRPWLQLRMPTFGLTDAEANQLVAYFNGLAKVEIPYAHFNERAVPPENLEAARVLFSKEYFDCLSCHQQGDKKPEGPQEGWAPDLTLARNRLNPNWIVKWLQDPQKVQPGTKMPSFFPGGPENILGGKDDRQIEALRDYVMWLGRNASGGRVEAPAPRRMGRG
ncbi:MAG TPA: c-type cytochrome [Candidatus Acidoferrales bacterium]|nr:c-type cytochrome [Candidatus Acidoferrales bacterium]